MQRTRWVRALALCAAPALVLGCSDSDSGGSSSSASKVAQRLDSILETGLNTITADAVAALFFDGDPANDPFILDTREAADFAAGHIPGAVNVPLLEFPARYLAEGDMLIPADRNVAVISYHGGDGNMASLLINCVRIEDPANLAAYPWSKAVFMGMQAWTFDKALADDHRFPDDLGIYRVEEPTEDTPNAGGSFKLPSVKPSEKDVNDAILELADLYFQKYATQFELQHSAVDLEAELGDGDPTDDPEVLSVRGAPDYAKGHIPSATNIGWKDVAASGNSKILDPSKRVVVYCYTGHTGSLATMALGILGYDVVNLLYGINGWTLSKAVSSGQLDNFDLNRGWDFPVDGAGGGNLGDLAAYVPPSGCVECHTSLTGIFYDLTVDPVAVVTPPPSTGEG